MGTASASYTSDTECMVWAETEPGVVEESGVCSADATTRSGSLESSVDTFFFNCATCYSYCRITTFSAHSITMSGPRGFLFESSACLGFKV